MRWVGSDGVEFGVGDVVECVKTHPSYPALVVGARYVACESVAGTPYIDAVSCDQTSVVVRSTYANRYKLVRSAGTLNVGTNVRTTLPVDSAARKEVPIYSGPFRMFPAALAGLARVCRLGSAKHNPSEPIQHNRAKSKDHADCIGRHLLDMSEDFGHGVGRDEKGVPQVDYIVWRAAALSQEWHEVHDGAPVAPAATNVGKDGVR